MARTRRRGGGWLDYANPMNWGKSQADIAAAKAEKCKKKQEALDKECSPAEAAAADTSSVADASAEAAGAPASSSSSSTTGPTPTGGRSRRRRQTRRKYKGGKHRKGHRA